MEVVAALVAIASIVFGVFSLVVLVLKLKRRPATTGVTDATVEIPSTEAHRAALARGVRFATRLFVGLAVGAVVVFLGIGLAVALTSPGTGFVEGLAISAGRRRSAVVRRSAVPSPRRRARAL